MVIDSSALLAVFYREQEFEKLQVKMDAAQWLCMSAATHVESSVAVLRKLGASRMADLQELIQALQIEVISFDATQAGIAEKAYVRYGRGRHPAMLNLGDCFSYALTIALDEQLLFKGNDFGKTDVGVA
jgi:ribonuclease VapC